MKRTRFSIAIALVVALVLAIVSCGGTSVRPAREGRPFRDDRLLGRWSGKLVHGDESQDLSLRFAIDDATRGLVLYLDQPEMKLHDVGPGPVEEHDGSLETAPFRFHLTPDGARIVGTMSFDGNDVTFELARGALPEVRAPAAPEVPTRSPVWTLRTGGAIWSSPAVESVVVFFGSNDGAIRAVHVRDGSLVWKVETGGFVMGRPTLDGGFVYALSDDGFLYKLAAADGHTVWRFDTHGGSIQRHLPRPPDDLEYDLFTSAATIADGVVYVGSADHCVYAVDATTGHERWHFETKGIVRSTPALSEGRVFVGSRGQGLYALDAKTGSLVWRFESHREITSSPLVANGRVYVGSRSSNLYALDASSGAVRWTWFYWTSWVESSASLRDGVLYIGSSDYATLFAISAETGRKRWAFDTNGAAWSTPAVTESLVYEGAVGILHVPGIDHRGGFFAVDRATGKARWRYPMAEIPGETMYGVASSPAVADGVVVFGGLDGVLYAFAER